MCIASSTQLCTLCVHISSYRSFSFSQTSLLLMNSPSFFTCITWYFTLVLLFSSHLASATVTPYCRSASFIIVSGSSAYFCFTLFVTYIFPWSCIFLPLRLFEVPFFLLDRKFSVLWHVIATCSAPLFHSLTS